jgi:transcription elongation GreA/GreB family factor
MRVLLVYNDGLIDSFDTIYDPDQEYAHAQIMTCVEEDDEEETYRIVTTVRSDSLSNLISIESPMGKALLGRKVGDRVEVKVSDAYSYYVVIRKIEKTTDDSGDKIRSY